jgi:hypothetical protein
MAEMPSRILEEDSQDDVNPIYSETIILGYPGIIWDLIGDLHFSPGHPW